MIGSFGSVVFVASEQTMRTFDGFSRSTAARWSVHEIHQKHPKAEYVGPGQDIVAFTMHFDVRYGMNPRKELNALLELCRSGKTESLILGGVAMGVYKWYIESVKQNYDVIDNQGKVLVGSADVVMKEYVN